MTGLLLMTLLQGQALPSTDAPRPVTEAAPTLSTEDALRIENHRLRTELLQTQVRLQSFVLQQEREQVEQAVRKAHPGFAIDWGSGALVPLPKTEPRQ